MRPINLRTSTIATLVGLVASHAAAQLSPDWIERYASPDGRQDQAIAVVIDDAGNSYITGNAGFGNLGTWDIITVSYAPDGTQRWITQYDGPSQSQDLASAMTFAPNGDILILARSEGGYTVLRYDPATGSQVARLLHEPGGIAHPNAFVVDDDGSIYITGLSWTDNQNDFYTVKLNSSGIMQWHVRWNGNGSFLFAHDVAIDIVLDQNGDVIVTGPSNSPTAEDYVTFKYRGTDGATMWMARYAGGINDIPYDLAIDDAGDVYITGKSAQSGDVFATVKYRSTDGREMWVAIDRPSVRGIGTDLLVDGDYLYTTGRADPDFDDGNFNNDVYTTKRRTSDGSIVWTNRYGSPQVNWYDVPSDLALDTSGNLFITGGTEIGLLLLLQYDAVTGEQLDVFTYHSGTNEFAGATDIAVGPTGDVHLSGIARNVNTEQRDYLALKFTGLGCGADFNNDGILNTLDFLDFLNAYNAGDPAADFNGDGAVNTLDFLAFLNAFNLGCE